MAEHTPTPWRVEFLRWTPEAPICGFGIRSDYTHPNLPPDFRMCAIASANISERAAYTACFTPEEIEANAAFIVKAVNSHEALVSALEDARSFMVEMRARHGDSGVGILIRAADAALRPHVSEAGKGGK